MHQIKPAIRELSNGEMPSEDFQRVLYGWFEEQGIMSHLKSYLRVLMINRLREPGGKLELSVNSKFSMSKQAFSLIMAEHLMQEGCHYTLSIFSTEVPGILNQLPASPFDGHFGKQPDDKWRFDQDSVHHLLELVGISKGTFENKKISNLYYNHFGSLLYCIVDSKHSSDYENNFEHKEHETFASYLNRILSHAGIPLEIINKLETKIQQLILSEREQVSTVTKNYFEGNIEQLNKQIVQKDTRIQQLLDEQINLKGGTKKLKIELKDSKTRIHQLNLQENCLMIQIKALEDSIEKLSLFKINLETETMKLLSACNLKHCTEVCQKNVEENHKFKMELTHLESTNEIINSEKERLHLKMNQLVQDLQRSQIKLKFLNMCLAKVNKAAPQKKGNVSDFSLLSSDTSEVTEEVIKQVHSKLDELERESDELDVKYKKLKMKKICLLSLK